MIEVSGPFGNAVCWLFLLKSSQDGLVFHSDLHQFFLPLHSVQTGFLDAHRIVEGRLRVLHDVRHLL